MSTTQKVANRQKQQKILAEEFQNVYALSKTLKFSLIPVLPEFKDRELTRQAKVEKFLEIYKKDIDADEERAKKYLILKRYLTELHKIFIKESLTEIKKEDLDFTELVDNLIQLNNSNDDKEKKKLIEGVNKLKKEIAKKFGNKDGKGGIFQKVAAEKYYDKLKGKGVKIYDDDNKKQRKNNILLSRNILEILKIKASEVAQNYYEISKKEKSIEEIEKEVKNIADYFNGWVTYFKNFNEIRGNLYKDDGRKDDNDNKNDKVSKGNAGQITTRILDENLDIFVNNKIIIEKSLKELGKNLSDLSQEQRKVFDPNYFNNCFLQTDINEYKRIIGEVNSYLNQEAQKQQKKIKFLNPLYKQLLLTDGLEIKEEFKEIQTFQDLGEKLFEENFLQKVFDKSIATKNLFNFILEENQEKIEIKSGVENILGTIVLDSNKISFYSNQIFGNWNYLKNLYLNFGIDGSWSKSKKEEYQKKRKTDYEVGVSFLEWQEILNSVSEEEFQNDLKKGNFQGIDNKGKIFTGDNFANFVWNLKNYFIALIDGRIQETKREQQEIRELKRTVEKLQEAKRKGERIDRFVLNYADENEYRKVYIESLEKKLQKVLRFKDNYDKPEQQQKFKKALNEYFDRLIQINKFISLFEDKPGVENDFLEIIREFNKNNNFVSVFNNVRNFITQKVEEQDKFKLNFERKTLLNGWTYPQKSHPRSSEYNARILRKNESYYLLIFNNQHSNKDNSFLEGYEIMDYFQQKGQTLFGSSWSIFGETYKDSKSKKTNGEMLDMVWQLVEKQNLAKEFPSVEDKLLEIKNKKDEGFYNFKVSSSNFLNEFKNRTGKKYSDYKNKKGLKRKEDISIQIFSELAPNKFNYSDKVEKEFIWKKIKDKLSKSEDYWGVDKMVFDLTRLESYFYKTSFKQLKLDEKGSEFRNKQIYLFQIYNKDFSPTRKEGSKPNLHTLYFLELFSKENQKNPIFKLSGQGEMFFKYPVEHSKWEKQNLVKNGRKENVWKHRRQTHANIYLHLSTVWNFINQGGSVDEKVKQYIVDHQNLQMIGIDRGEKELAYLCRLNNKGEIQEIKSLNKTGKNIVEGKIQNINYHQKLDLKEKERQLARKSWAKIEGIKDLKKGYLSSIVRDIAEMIVNNDTFLCLEELNYGFKRGRIKIEKSLYQQFENALLNKLSYLVLEKNQQGIRNALQLSPPVGAQKYWSNQMGAVFYTDAKFTSKTCPNCGFRKRGINLSRVKQLKEKIENNEITVFYEKDKDRFRIEYDWKYEFTKTNKKKDELTNEKLYGKKEIIYSDIERSYFAKESNNVKQTNPNEELKRIFGIDSLQNYKGENLFESLKEEIENKRVNLGEFITQFNAIAKIRYDGSRNEITGKRDDIISCPKCHFDSRKAKLITNGDANGAYNIACRGLLIYEKIRELAKKKPVDKIKKNELKITLKDWDQYTYEQWDKQKWDFEKSNI